MTLPLVVLVLGTANTVKRSAERSLRGDACLWFGPQIAQIDTNLSAALSFSCHCVRNLWRKSVGDRKSFCGNLFLGALFPFEISK